MCTRTYSSLFLVTLYSGGPFGTGTVSVDPDFH